MKNILRSITVVALGAAMLTGFTSCEATKNANNKQKGAVIGATGGAILGAIIGNNAGKGGNGELGAVIGGVVGGGAGVLIGNKMDKQFNSFFQIIQSENPLKDELKKMGLIPEDVTHVIFSHLHFDHAGGATKLNEEGQPMPAFPNAEYFITESQWKQANNPNVRDRASYMQRDFMPLQAAGLLQLIPENSSIINGISTYCVNGHTCGQQLVKIKDGDHCLFYCGDLIPLKSHLQLPWIMGYDLNALLTLDEKTQFLSQAADENWWLVFDHDPVTSAVKIPEGKKYYDIIEEDLRISG
jgi:glyoxylase-like metal-dependent hydrolase (beta-lactamase superfamily II)